MTIEFAETCITTNYSFLEGGSHPEEYIELAAGLGYRGVGLTDRQSFSGIVRGHCRALEKDIRYLVGTRLFFLNEDHTASFEVLAYPQTKESYQKLCKVLTTGNLRAEKGSSFIYLKDIASLSPDTFFTVLYPRGAPYEISRPFESQDIFEKLFADFYEYAIDRKKLFLALSITYTSQDKTRALRTIALSVRYSIPLLATNDALYHSSDRKALQDILTCIKHGTTIQEAGFLLSHNAERYLKPVTEIARLFSQYPKSLRHAIDLLEACPFSLKDLTYTYPKEIIPAEIATHTTPAGYLRKLTYEGGLKRYPQGIPAKVAGLIEEELALIDELHYEQYFLTCADIVRFARSKDILCQGRGAAANSVVCFCLEITAVDPTVVDLLFARFISKERSEPPDIDIDFEHERREEVMQYIYEKYGRNRAGLVSNVITYQKRSAMRDVGKALGLSLKTVDALSKLIHYWNKNKIAPEDFLEIGIRPDDPVIQICNHLSDELIDFPRHLSQHVGGFIISDTPLDEIVPILHSAMESRTIIEWNKDDVDLMGMLKIDILALGMLTCLRKALSSISDQNEKEDLPALALHTIPQEDPKTYDMICEADTIGVFQIESRAQMSMLPRLRPRRFYDLVIEVAIVRPGPIQGNMVHPFLRRRDKKEEIKFPDDKIREILEKTMGVPIFQEQAMRLAIEVAGFTPGEAEKLRRTMAMWKRNREVVDAFKKRIADGMEKKGYSEEFSQVCMEQMKGFSEYGFPESHAASFALLVYASSWIKRHHPAHFAVALLNSQPMGFYSPSQLIRDAKDHGITVLPIDIKRSQWDCTVLNKGAIRIGLRYVKGLCEQTAKSMLYALRISEEVGTITELYTTAAALGTPLRRDSLAAIARADGFASFGISVREALWEIRGLPMRAGMLDSLLVNTTNASLRKESLPQQMFLDYIHTGFSLKAHPIALIRNTLEQHRLLFARDLRTVKTGTRVGIVGISVCRQRPPTAKGVVFLTLEDETGNTNVIIKPKIYTQFRRIITSSSGIIAKGILERNGAVMHLVVDNLEGVDSLIKGLREEVAKDQPLPAMVRQSLLGRYSG